jgi:hypothetical protein
VYGALVPQYVQAIRGDGWEQLFERHGVEMALLPPGVPLVKELRDAGWVAILRDPVQILLVSPDYEAAQ